MKFIDIHCHLQFSQFDNDREEVIERMKKNNVSAIVVGTDLEMSKKAVELAEKHENLWATIGLHPNDKPEAEFNLDDFRDLAKSDKVVAVGECGLDFFRNGDKKEAQIENFLKQIEFAVEIDKPLMIHTRDAHNEVLEILIESKKRWGNKLRGNIHFFTGDLEIAQKYFDLGFSISFTGLITFVNDFDDVIKNAPENMIMSETDAPYVAPVPHRGKRNEPIYVQEVVKKISELKNWSKEKTTEILHENAKRIFGIE